MFNAATVTREATVMMGLFAREGAARQFHHWVSITEVLTQTWMVLPTAHQSFPTAASRQVEHGPVGSPVLLICPGDGFHPQSALLKGPRTPQLPHHLPLTI